MDLVSLLLAMGFWESGSPKGFALEPDGLVLWVKGGPLPRARQDLWDAVLSVAPRVGVDLTGDQALDGWLDTEMSDRLAVRLPARLPGSDVWVVGEDEEAVRGEMERWQARGYRSRHAASHPETNAVGLVVRLDERDPKFLGCLPRHPRSGSMVQSWH